MLLQLMGRTDGKRAQALGLLALLYFAEGLPFGFQSTALPSYLRAKGVSLVGIGFLGLLSLPWMTKALWAPLVDRYGSDRIGRRKAWILPNLAGLAASCALAGALPPEGRLVPLLGLVFLMNFFAATADIAIDGLAIDILEPTELGPANAVQVVGYKIGMLTGGGLLVYLSHDIGWHGLFGAMSALVFVVFLVTLGARERPRPSHAASESMHADITLGTIIGDLKRALLLPDGMLVVALIATYKLGETMIDVMFKPFLVDHGVEPETIGLWVGTYGMIASLAGSVFGGIMSTRISLLRAVEAAAVLRVVPMIGVVLVSLGEPTAGRVILVLSSELFFGGALTTAMFAFMMSRVDRKIGATHYTLFASIEVLGKLVAGWFSGLLGAALGYTAVFAVGVSASLLYLGLFPPLRRSLASTNGSRSLPQ